MKIALLQLDIACGRTEINIKHTVQKIEEAMVEQPDVIVLPEMWNSSYDLQSLARTSDKSGFPAAHTICEIARLFKVNIVAGSVADLREEKIYNTSYVFNREGEQIAAYSKVHLFDLMKESDFLVPGLERVSFALDGIKCGVIICYDLRFPELSRALTLDGINILFVPAQWPYPRLHPWRTLLQARAIENQIFVVGVNRVGQEGKTVFFGNSMVVNPWGEILVEGKEEEEIITADIDLEEVVRIRNNMSCLLDRVPEVYK